MDVGGVRAEQAQVAEAKQGDREMRRFEIEMIQNPQAMKEGVLMPNLGVKPEEAKALVAYLRAHQ